MVVVGIGEKEHVYTGEVIVCMEEGMGCARKLLEGGNECE